MHVNVNLILYLIKKIVVYYGEDGEFLVGNEDVKSVELVEFWPIEIFGRGEFMPFEGLGQCFLFSLSLYILFFSKLVNLLIPQNNYWMLVELLKLLRLLKRSLHHI